MDYIFNVENIGYLRYRLRNVINLTSRYSYVLYLYFEQNRRMHLSWEISLDDLKALLRCTAETYSQYKRFNDLVLKKCHKELNEKTECHFSYEPIKKGRKVTAIRFTLEPINSEIDLSLPGQISLEDHPAHPLRAYRPKGSGETLPDVLRRIYLEETSPFDEGDAVAQVGLVDVSLAMLKR